MAWILTPSQPEHTDWAAQERLLATLHLPFGRDDKKCHPPSSHTPTPGHEGRGGVHTWLTSVTHTWTRWHGKSRTSVQPPPHPIITRNLMLILKCLLERRQVDMKVFVSHFNKDSNETEYNQSQKSQSHFTSHAPHHPQLLRQPQPIRTPRRLGRWAPKVRRLVVAPVRQYNQPARYVWRPLPH